jgi:hypothetical protein
VLLKDDSFLKNINGTAGDLRMNSECRLCIYKGGSCRWTSSGLIYAPDKCPHAKFQAMLAQEMEAIEKTLEMEAKVIGESA